MECCSLFMAGAPDQCSLLLGWITIFEMVMGLIVLTNTEKLNAALDIGFNKTFKEYTNNKDVWDMVQSELKCCGIHGSDDYKPIFNSTELPKSCCLDLAEYKVCTKVDASHIGCKLALYTLFNSDLTRLGVVAIVTSLIQVSRNSIQIECCA